jgi:hypothetical protein
MPVLARTRGTNANYSGSSWDRLFVTSVLELEDPISVNPQHRVSMGCPGFTRIYVDSNNLAAEVADMAIRS